MAYITLYDVPKRPPVISPEFSSITAPSPGSPPTKLKVPPVSPRTLAVAPSHVAINSNEGSSCSSKLTVIFSYTVQSKSNTSTTYSPD